VVYSYTIILMFVVMFALLSRLICGSGMRLPIPTVDSIRSIHIGSNEVMRTLPNHPSFAAMVATTNNASVQQSVMIYTPQILSFVITATKRDLTLPSRLTVVNSEMVELIHGYVGYWMKDFLI